MKEMLQHPAYKRIEKLDGVVLDYVILEGDNSYMGKESHKHAAIEAMKIIAKRLDDWAFDKMNNDLACSHMTRKDFPIINIAEDKIEGKLYSTEQFFAVPEDPYYKNKPQLKVRSWSIDQYAEYAFSFLEPPYGNKWVLKDWQDLNDILFPNKDGLIIYSWNTDWSNYFDDGLEWWGAHFWTVFDKLHNMYVVIGASATD